MKRILLVLTLGAALSSTAFAQPDTTTNTPPPGPPPGEGEHHHGMDFLTDADKQELHKAHDAAIAANPALGTEEESLKSEMEAARESGTPPTDDQKEQWHAFREKMDAAMIAADPDVAPILAKIKAHHHGPGGPGGPPPSTPPSGT